MFIFSERVVKKYKFLMTISLSFIFFLLSKDNALASGYTHEHDASCYVDEVALCESHHIRTENKTSTYYCQYCMKKTSHADTRYYDVCDYNYIDEVDAGLYQVCNECNNIRFNDTPFTKSHYYTASVLNCGLGTGETLATISLSSSHNDWTNSNITLSANVNVLHSSFTLASAPYDFGGGYGTSSTYEVASNGTYSVSVKAGNGETKSASITISNIDKTAPSLSISKSTEAWSENGLYIKASAQDSESGILGYSLNGGAFDTGSSFKVMTNGTYTVSVKDYAGNVTSDSITISNIGRDPKIVQAEKEAAEKAAAAEKLAAEKAEAERVAAEKAAAEKAAAEKAAAEKLAAEKAAAEKAAAEKAAAEKAAAEKAAAEKLAAEKLAAEKAAAEKAAAEKAAAEKLAAEKLAAEKAAAEKAAAEKAAAEKAAAEKAAAEKAAAEKAAAEKLAAEKAAAEKAEAEKIAAEKLAAEKAAAEKVAKEKLAAEKAAAEKAAAEKEAAEKAAAAKEALEKAAQEKTEAAIQAAKKAEEEKLAAEKILKEKEEAHAAAANSASAAEKEASKAEAEREEAEKILNEKTKAEVDANKKASDAESLAAAATKDKKTADKLLSEKEAAEKDAKDTALEAERYLKDLLAGNQIAKGETEQSDGVKGLLAGTLGKGKIKNGTYTTDNGEILVADYDEEKGDIDVKGSVLLVKGGTSKGVNGLILVSDSLNDSKTSPMFSEEDILFDGLTAKEAGLTEGITLATDVYTNSDSASIVNGVAFSKPDTKTIFKIGILLLVIALLWFSTFSYVYKIEKGKIKIVSLVAIKKMDQRLIVEISEDKLTNHGKYMIYYSPWVKLTKKDKMVYVMIKERENVLNTDSGLSFTY